MTGRAGPVNQGRKPTGWLGRFTLWRMNASHSGLTDWGLGHISVGDNDTIRDVGCGGGTVSKLAAIGRQGKSTASMIQGSDVSRLAEKFASRTGMVLLDEQRELLTRAGYSEVQVIEKRSKGWLSAFGTKPIPRS